MYSVRVTLGHRALRLVEGDEVVWFWIGSHADYDRLLSSFYSSGPGLGDADQVGQVQILTR